MRHDLDGEGLGHSPGTEPLAPKLMLRLIGWSHQYQRRMARLGAGAERALLSDETTESVITAYIGNTRSVSQQLSKNIIFCEQQTMLQVTPTRRAAASLTQGCSLWHMVLQPAPVLHPPPPLPVLQPSSPCCTPPRAPPRAAALLPVLQPSSPCCSPPPRAAAQREGGRRQQGERTLRGHPTARCRRLLRLGQPRRRLEQALLHRDAHRRLPHRA